MKIYWETGDCGEATVHEKGSDRTKTELVNGQRPLTILKLGRWGKFTPV